VVAHRTAAAQTSPPPDYQQQPPPQGYQPPPQGYPPPQQQGYPPAYQPPPGYAPPPGYGPPPPPQRSGFLALPYIGVHTHTGNTGEGLDPGLTIGALLGGRLNQSFSLNGELRIDFLNVDNSDANIVQADVAFSPLFHAPVSPTAEFVVGPKIGGYGLAGDAAGVDYSESGLSAGFNAGMFFAVSPTTSLGGMLSFTIRDPSEVCQSAAGYEYCLSGSFPSYKVLSFNFGALL
jgi:hypothetical protein